VVIHPQPDPHTDRYKANGYKKQAFLLLTHEIARHFSKHGVSLLALHVGGAGFEAVNEVWRLSLAHGLFSAAPDFRRWAYLALTSSLPTSSPCCVAYQDRLDTLQSVRNAGISVCCGGIVGMGETSVHRAGLIAQLANLNPYPESVPINSLVRVPGTPLVDSEPVDPFDFVRTIAASRITMPKARVRLSAGRQQLGDAVQALCFMAGANSIFYGDKLLVTGNPDTTADLQLLSKLGLKSRGQIPIQNETLTPSLVGHTSYR
jgi:hypothetical protein